MLFRTLLLVFTASVCFIALDTVLANTERRETALEAARLYRDGEQSMKEGKYADAAESFRNAIANARNNTDYPLALGEALLLEGKLDDAASTLTDLLKAAPMAGGANLAMARVLAKQDQFDAAAFYYHRAIYGQWKNDPAANQVRARFELTDLLARHNSKSDLLAELLLLQETAPFDAPTRKRLAALYMTAGSPARAAAVFQDLAHTDPGDADVSEGEADAAFASGDYAAAQKGYIATLRLRPDDEKARRQLEMTDQVLNLDPMRKGLGQQERIERGIHILQVVSERAQQCPALAGSDLSVAATAAIGHVAGAASRTDSVQENLDMAGKLWHSLQVNCPAAIAEADQSLRLVLEKTPAP